MDRGLISYALTGSPLHIEFSIFVKGWIFMGQRSFIRLRALLSRLGLAGETLQHDSCTIHFDTLGIHLVCHADRWAVLFCEIGVLAPQADAALLRRLLCGNLLPADGATCVLALDHASQQVVLWCQADFTACDDVEFFQLFERFVHRAEQSQTWLQQGCLSDGIDAANESAPLALPKAAMSRFSGNKFRIPI